MKKVLISHSYFYRFDKKQWETREPYPPLMTLIAAALMRRNGFEVQLFDSCLEESEQAIVPILESFEPDYFVVFDDGFNYLTKMCLTTMREAAFRMQQLAKSKGAVTITCSSDSTDHLQKYLTHGGDYVIKGEGETTLEELINTIESGEDTKHVKGISYIVNGKVINNPPRGVNRNLDDLPFPAWDLIDVEAYRKIWMQKGGPFYLNIATTRGCPYKCNWCAKPIYGNRYNVRSPKLAVDEIAHHVEKYQVDHFWMCDDIFGLKPGWVQSFRDELAARNLSIKYKIQSRADLLLQEDNIDALVASGLDEVWIGAESGSQNILDAMDKGTSIAQIQEATRILKKKGVKVAFFIQFGYLGETREDIDKTIDLVLDLMPDKLGASVSYPLPGTKFYDMVKQDLKEKSNWTDSDDLDMMFKNTYSRKFYKILHRYLHNRHRIRRGAIALKDMFIKPRSMNRARFKHVAAMGLHIPEAIFNQSQLKMLEQKNEI